MFTSAFFIAAGITLAVLIAGFAAFNYGVSPKERRWSYVTVFALIAMFVAVIIVGPVVAYNESQEYHQYWKDTCVAKGGEIVYITDTTLECFRPGYEIVPIP